MQCTPTCQSSRKPLMHLCVTLSTSPCSKFRAATACALLMQQPREGATHQALAKRNSHGWERYGVHKRNAIGFRNGYHRPRRRQVGAGIHLGTKSSVRPRMAKSQGNRTLATNRWYVVKCASQKRNWSDNKRLNLIYW